jgi:AmmeMemoRadiSam system protein A
MNLQAPTERGDVLLTIARASIASRFGIWFETDHEADFLRDTAACFVTLTQDRRLRGCIGSLEPRRPLLDDVRANALAAAFQDPRFAPLSAAEFNVTRIEVSVLSPLKPLEIADEEDALKKLRPGIDGVVLACDGRRGTFLPQVWESLPQPRQFLSELKRKAGLPADFWSQHVQLFRYEVEKWCEQ